MQKTTLRAEGGGGNDTSGSVALVTAHGYAISGINMQEVEAVGIKLAHARVLRKYTALNLIGGCGWWIDICVARCAYTVAMGASAGMFPGQVTSQSVCLSDRPDPQTSLLYELTGACAYLDTDCMGTGRLANSFGRDRKSVV